MIDLNLHLTQPTSLQNPSPICCGNDINDSGEISVAAFDPNFNGGDFLPAVLVPQQGAQSTSERLPVQSAAAVKPSVLPSDFLQRFGKLGPRGWRIAR
jgi:hypothetical protein